MKGFALLAALSLTACGFSVSPRTPSGIPLALVDQAEYDRIYTHIDKNQDQFITAAEIQASNLDLGDSILYSQTVTGRQTPEKYIELYDVDFDQKLSKDELKGFGYAALFKSVDINKDGAWQKSDLMSPGHSYYKADPKDNEEHASTTLMGFDQNKDGKITFQEFLNSNQKTDKPAT
jgi:Ca2+-binding EF-hand superfamily protein